MTIGRENELNVKASAFGISLGLGQAIASMKLLPLCLYESQGDGLCIDIDLDPQNVIDLPAPAPPTLAIDDLDLTGGLLAPDEVFGPPAPVDGRVDEFGSCIGFVVVVHGPDGIRIEYGNR